MSLAGAIRYEDLVEADRIHASLYTDPRIFADERIFERDPPVRRLRDPERRGSRWRAA